MYERFRHGIQNFMYLNHSGGQRRNTMSQTTKSRSQRIQQQGFSSIATEAERLNLNGAADLGAGAALAGAFSPMVVSATLTDTATSDDDVALIRVFRRIMGASEALQA
jgi:hypothetical protein